MYGLLDTVHDEQRTAVELVSLLQREQLQLERAELDTLPEVTARKSESVARLAELAARRESALAVAGFGADRAGMQRWLEREATPADGRQRWDALVAALERAQELNRVNGLLIRKHLTRTQQALNLLQNGSTALDLYGPDGQAAAPRLAPRRRPG